MIDNDWPLCTTNWTLYEAATGLSCREERHDWAVQLLETAQKAAEILKAEEVEAEAISTFKTHEDKRWSVVDCANFQVLRRQDCQQAFAFDKNFRQAQSEFGFEVLA